MCVGIRSFSVGRWGIGVGSLGGEDFTCFNYGMYVAQGTSLPCVILSFISFFVLLNPDMKKDKIDPRSVME